MIVAVQLGQEHVCEGLNAAAAHIDSPCIGARIKKFDENYNLATLLCNVEGGIDPKDYFNRTLLLHYHGTRDDGTRDHVVDFFTGRGEAEPRLIFNEGSFHLDEGDVPQIKHLEAVIGSKPYDDKNFDPARRITLNVMNKLFRDHGITEEDITNAKISLVPAEHPSLTGLDGSLVAGYGQDNWACAYPLLAGFLSVKKPVITKIAIFYNREETGDRGKGSLQTEILGEQVIPALVRLLHGNGAEESKVERNTWRLFLDVLEPIHNKNPLKHDNKQSPYIGSGVVILPHSGDEWGYDGHESSPEFRSAIMRIFRRKGVLYQQALMGNPDHITPGSSYQFHHTALSEGIDCGVPCLGLHRAIETTSSADVYTLSRAISAFFSVANHKTYMPK